MAPSFGRSISFPLSPARSSSSSSSSSSNKTKPARHVRSISLPTCRSAHPLLAHLHATTLAARAWTTSTSSSSSPSAGLAHLDALHAALADLLALPEPRAALLSSTTAAAFSDRVLDALLALADAHGAFREILLELHRHAAEAQAALRRRRNPSSAVRAQRAAEKDLARLASSAARAATKLPHLLLPAQTATVAAVEVAGVIAEALAAAAYASAAVFTALEAVSSAATTASAAAASASSKKPTATILSLVTRSSKVAAGSEEDREVAALERMERLDECVAEMEGGSDKVFRSILHARVALLNIRTQAC